MNLSDMYVIFQKKLGSIWVIGYKITQSKQKKFVKH